MTTRLPRIAGALRAARGVRTRLAVLATVLFAVALAVAAILMLAVLHRSLINSADAATGARAGQIATALATEPVAELDSSELAPSKNLDVIQVLAPDGRVLVATPHTGTVPLVAPAPSGAAPAVVEVTARNGEDYRASTRSVASRSGPLTVVAAAAEGPLNDVVTTVALLFASVFPVLLVLLAVSAYVLSGRVLRPVERIRAQVSEISGTDLSRRVDEPTTGDEIAALAVTMNQMLARLDASQRRQLQFVGDASHELRSPLTSISAVLEMAQAGTADIDDATLNTILIPEAARLEGLVGDLLLLAKADERGVPLRLGDVDVDDLVGDEATRLVHHSALAVRTKVVGMRVSGDRDRLARALRNVVDNAVRHARSQIAITMSTSGDTGVIVVDDDGPGIPAADRARVFDRFVRLDAPRERQRGGSGLGLAIVAEIISAHGGAVAISQAPIGGARVEITLPRQV